MGDPRTLGQLNYEVYREALAKQQLDLGFSRERIDNCYPVWDGLEPEDREAFEQAAFAVLSLGVREFGLSGRD